MRDNGHASRLSTTITQQITTLKNTQPMSDYTLLSAIFIASTLQLFTYALRNLLPRFKLNHNIEYWLYPSIEFLLMLAAVYFAKIG
jgi:hypothetical protein